MQLSKATGGRLLAVLSVGLLIASVAPLGAANAGNRHREFQPVSAFLNEAEGAELKTPAQFEAEAAMFPVTGSQVLFSRCRKAPLNATNTYPSLYGEVDTINADTSFAYADGSSCYNPQNEQNIAVSPSNPNLVITSANDYRDDFRNCWIYRSTNGGSSWNNVALPGWDKLWSSSGPQTASPCGGDPVIAFGPNNKVYFAALSYVKGKSALAVARSDDGGATWNDPVLTTVSSNTQIFHDKEWIAVGPDGSVYLTWTMFREYPGGGYMDSNIFIAKSTNLGVTWTDPVLVSANYPYDQGSQVGVTPGGYVVVAYEGAAASTGYTTDALVVARSTTPGGLTFTNREVARIYDDFSCYPTQLPGAQDRQTLTNMQFRINSFPSMAIDPTNGTVAIVWADNKGVGNCGSTTDMTFTGSATSNQVRMVTGTLNATRWSSVRQITTGAADKVYPAVGANRGIISVGYYTRAYSTSVGADRRCGIMELDTLSGAVVPPSDPARAAATVCLDYAMRSSTSSFLTERRLTNVSSNPYVQFAGSFIGDYTGAVVDSLGRSYFVWTDFRGKPGSTTPNQDTLVRRY